MINPHAKIASLLRTKEGVVLDLEEKMEGVTGRSGIMKKIAEENEVLVRKTLEEFGLSENSSAEEVHDALLNRLIFLDDRLFETLGRPNLCEEKGAQVLINKGRELVNKNRGFFLKEDKARELLMAVPPKNILKIFGYKDADELLASESLWEVYSALRFLEDASWMNERFLKNYEKLSIDDFEEREVKVIVLKNKWVQAAEKFMKKKYHNLSHLKELGVVFIVPVKVDGIGETTRLFSLLLHYLNEITFYSSLFKRCGGDGDFPAKLMSFLRGDVSEGPLPDGEKLAWRIVQRYLAKDDPSDPRLFEPHVNPESEHWYNAENDLAKLAGGYGEPFGYWKGMDFVGDLFEGERGAEIISFDLIDLVMSLVKGESVKYLYHQQESLWNKIFMEYFSREEMNSLISENIIKGYITL